MPELRINASRTITADMIRRETVDNQERIIIRSATMPGDVIMNRILYPREERDKSLSSFNGIPAPLGHPRKDGIFVSASDLDAFENYHVGGRVDNAEIVDDRIFHDTIINVNYAKQFDRGRKVLEAIENMEKTGVPIHTSTGVYMRKKVLDSPMVNEKGEEYDAIAYDLRYDHNAILINEEGAATPQQGVGLAVNSAGEELELMTVNEDDEYIDDSESISDKLDWLRDMLHDAIALKETEAERIYVMHNGIYEDKVVYEVINKDNTEVTYSREYRFMEGQVIVGDERTRVERKTLWKVVKDSMSFIRNMAFAPRIDAAYNEGSSNTILHGNQTEDSEMTPEDKAALVADITEKVTANLAEAVTSAVQPLSETVGKIQANMQANEDAERAPLIEKAKAKGASDSEIAALSTNMLKALIGAPADKSATYATGGEPIETNSDDYKTVMPNSKKGG